MKTFRMLSVVAVLVSGSVIGTAQTLSQKGYGGSVGGGISLLATTGPSYNNPSYNNPSVGGFVRVYYSNGKINVRNIFEVTNDQKVFEPDGMTVRDRVLVGVLIGKFIRPVVGLEFVRHSNSDYTKTGVAPGVGVMLVVKSNDRLTTTEPYFVYFFPDTSPNKSQRYCFGFEMTRQLKERLQLFLAGQFVLQKFDQPFTYPVIHGLIAQGFGLKVGLALPFGKPH